MPFAKGISGNDKGRPKGTSNKTCIQLRETINDFLQNNFETVVKDFGKLQPKERVKFYCDLLQFGLPRLQAVELETEFDRLTDTQLNVIIEGLKKTNHDTQRQD